MAQPVLTPAHRPTAAMPAAFASPWIPALGGLAIEIAAMRLPDMLQVTLHLTGANLPTALGAGIDGVVEPVVQTVALVCGAAALNVGLAGRRERMTGLTTLTGRDIPFLLAGLFFITLSACLTHAALVVSGLDVVTQARGPAALLAGTLLLPLAHELLLRGTIQPMLRASWGLSASIVTTALIGTIALPHGLMDIGPVGAGLALGPGLLIGWTAASCRSMAAAGALHVTYAVALAALHR